MAKSTEEQLEDAIATAGDLALKLTDGAVQHLTVDFQASGELPFRMQVPNETLPMIGLARLRSSTPVNSATTSTVAEPGKGR